MKGHCDKPVTKKLCKKCFSVSLSKEYFIVTSLCRDTFHFLGSFCIVLFQGSDTHCWPTFSLSSIVQVYTCAQTLPQNLVALFKCFMTFTCSQQTSLDSILQILPNTECQAVMTVCNSCYVCRADCRILCEV